MDSIAYSSCEWRGPSTSTQCIIRVSAILREYFNMERRDAELYRIVKDIRNMQKLNKADIQYIRDHANDSDKMEIITIYNDILEWLMAVVDIDEK